ncbi:MAG: hypothetical protein ACXWPM_06805 [Bdellovibrionota bacterium]
MLKFWNTKPSVLKVSKNSQSKMNQLGKYLTYSHAQVWGRDTKLLRSNLLVSPHSRNYTVLMAMGRRA